MWALPGLGSEHQISLTHQAWGQDVWESNTDRKWSCKCKTMCVFPRARACLPSSHNTKGQGRKWQRLCHQLEETEQQIKWVQIKLRTLRDWGQELRCVWPNRQTSTEFHYFSNYSGWNPDVKVVFGKWSRKCMKMMIFRQICIEINELLNQLRCTLLFKG